MKPGSGLSQALRIGSVLAAMLFATVARGDVIMDWNAKADALAADKQLLNAPNSRGQAMLHIAMFEAVNAIERRYAPYKLNLSADKATSREAAAAAAAHDVLLALHPDKKADLHAALAASLSGIADNETKSKGIELGKQAAAGVIAMRENDGSNTPEEYRPSAAAGIYVPTTIPIESTSPKVRPFVMTSASQFRAPPPPTLTSETWTRDLNEIREIGSSVSAKRSPEQTTIARFWLFTGPRTYNAIVRQIATNRKMDLVDCARLYALTSIATADAFIAVFDAKYAYNLWRPITAIRNADLTSNPATPREASWQPLGTTPMHPEYPCAHCIVSSTVATVLQNIVGDEVGEITLTSPTAAGVTRKWTRLQDYSDEVSSARIYAGFHYRFSTEAGREMGKKIGDLTVATQMRGAVADAQQQR
ncbi:vanadium-dependent haloperoxidase [Bradyrhizobium sp. BWA-3-5]|uniref:vanadium-dependent haloperoxidase n=1 Tax=Bradyrhizobium sp. BWA-3-5 TaxID=3080013 RepID=UPI00293EFB2F|nr:vanadium-dependent haloperoxidase [Bradyrhizobium sp. BWA-3-5]WOH68959.1 vanadium-dependent haloperoxidase [Bradyrhizobium sp. BWA-3-5]